MYVRWSGYFLPTLKEEPAGARTASHRLMLRAGLLRRMAPGTYVLLPFGLRALKRLQRVVAEELEAVGAPEVRPPLLAGGDGGPAPGEIARPFAREIRSIRDLPLIFFWFGEGFGDEPRRGSGIVGARGFPTVEAIGLHAAVHPPERPGRTVRDACSRALVRSGLPFAAVEVPEGGVGLVALVGEGEEEVARCPACGYVAHRRLAHTAPPPPPPGEERPLELVATPGVRTVEGLVGFLGVSPAQVVKTFLYVGRDGPMAVLVRGDQELEEAKLLRAAGDPTLRRVDDPEEAARIAGAGFGFLGPIGLSIPVWADEAVRDVPAAVVGGNREGYHYVGAMAGRDFHVERYLDLHRTGEGDPCGLCGEPLRIKRGIEVGRIAPGEALEEVFVDGEGRERPLVLGYCRLDLFRTLAAVIERHHDGEGIIWPVELAPFHAVVAVLRPDVREQMELGERLAGALERAGLAVLLDDRDRSPGEKFHDAKLIGIPVLLVVGPRGLKRGEVEAERRRDGARISLPADPGAVVGGVRGLLRAESI